MENLKSIISYAMRMENDARDFYEYYLDKVTSESIKKIFEELVKMEEGHYSMLKVIYDMLDAEEPPLTISWVVDDTSKEVNPSIFADNSELIKDESSISDLSVLRMAYLMEKDFALFYKNAALKVEDDKAKKFLNELEDWEIRHSEILRGKYEALLEKNWGDVSKLILS